MTKYTCFNTQADEVILLTPDMCIGACSHCSVHCNKSNAFIYMYLIFILTLSCPFCIFHSTLLVSLSPRFGVGHSHLYCNLNYLFEVFQVLYSFGVAYFVSTVLL